MKRSKREQDVPPGPWVRGAIRLGLGLLLISTGWGMEARGQSSVQDSRVDAARSRGLRYLFSRQGKDGRWNSGSYCLQDGGAEALVVLAALDSGIPATDLRLQPSLHFLRKHSSKRTFTQAVSMMVFARLPQEFDSDLRRLTGQLLEAQKPDGSWASGPQTTTSGPPVAGEDSGNLCDTHIALLALQEARALGVLVGDSVFLRAWKFLQQAVNPDGGFGYQARGVKPFRLRGPSHGSATAAGMACLGTVAQSKGAAKARKAVLQSFQKSQAWLEKHYSVKTVPLWYWGDEPWYEYLWLLSGASDAIEPLRLGKWTLRKVLSTELLGAQNSDGSWTGRGAAEAPIAATAYAVLTLARIRRGSLIQKMILTTPPSDAPRADVANLCRWLQRSEGVRMSWRKISPKAPAKILSRSPILFLTGQGATPAFTESLQNNLREYLGNGGVILAAGDEKFQKSILKPLKDLNSANRFKPLPEAHPVLTLRFRTSGIQTKVLAGRGRKQIYLPASDLGALWNGGCNASGREAFQWFANLSAFICQSGWPNHTFDSPGAEAASEAHQSLRVARLQHEGDWQACPQVFRELSEVLTHSYSLSLKPENLSAEKTISRELTMVWLTGSKLAGLDSSAEKQIKGYLDSGGFLLIDSAYGDLELFRQGKKLIETLYGAEALKALDEKDPLLTGDFAGGIGADVTSVEYSQAAAKVVGNKTAPPQLLGVRKNGRLVVLLSRFGLTAGAEGAPPWDYVGYATPDARRIAANILLYALADKNGAIENEKKTAKKK